MEGTPLDNVIGCCVRGSAHIRAGTVCQDYYKIIKQPDYLLVAVADGHGSSACPYSDEGAQIAADVFCRLLETYYERYKRSENGLDHLEHFLRKDGEVTLAKEIEREWNRQIIERHMEQARAFPNVKGLHKAVSAIWRQYGTTLLGMMMTPQFVFAFQLGDGDITCIDAQGRMPFVNAETILGVETYSLSEPGAWRHTVSNLFKRSEYPPAPMLYMLSTDGMFNSYSSQDEFYKACADYYALFRELPMAGNQDAASEGEKGTGSDYLRRNLQNWLQETSDKGCGDDIAVVFCYCE